MITGHSFQHKDSVDVTSPADRRNRPDALIELLRDRVGNRFERMTGLPTLLLPLAFEFSGDSCRTFSATHPACAEFSDTRYCRESWRLHRAELERSPTPHWHQCDYAKWCGVVPVRHGSRCVAAFKLVHDGDMCSDFFERYVDLLDLLVRDVVESEGKPLADRVFTTESSSVVDSSSVHNGSPIRSMHAKVRRAIEYVEGHLSDTDLSVHGIATVLGIHPDYLAHLFAEQTKQRMCRYIAIRRVESAKNLLATTDWQIKRIAFATGHANPKWFSQHFRDYTGLTPSEFRRSKPRDE